MTTSVALRTSPTLLGRICQSPTDQAAWSRFVDQYGGRIYRWCRSWGLQDADAQDVTQTVLVKLAEKMRTFEYDPTRRFRGWLKTLAHHAWRNYVENRRRPGQGSGDSQTGDLLEEVAGPDDLARQLEEAFDHEVLEQAMIRVRLRVRRRTWDAFRLTALEGQKAAAVAEQLQMKVAHVFVAKSEVRQLLAEEVARLERTAVPTQGDKRCVAQAVPA
jgi:RNA polymerase sigma factor (sigma-70 family)